MNRSKQRPLRSARPKGRRRIQRTYFGGHAARDGNFAAPSLCLLRCLLFNCLAAVKNLSSRRLIEFHIKVRKWSLAKARIVFSSIGRHRRWALLLFLRGRRLKAFTIDQSKLPIAVILTGVFGSFIARQRTDHEIDAFADQLGRRIGMPVRRHFLDEFFHLLKSDFSVSHLASTKPKRHLHLHLFTEKIAGYNSDLFIRAVLERNGYSTALRGEQTYLIARKRAGAEIKRYPAFLYEGC